MKFSGALAVASLAIGQAAAGILNHRHFHMPRSAKPTVEVPEKYVSRVLYCGEYPTNGHTGATSCLLSAPAFSPAAV